jgi:hypothetical protein
MIFSLCCLEAGCSRQTTTGDSGHRQRYSEPTAGFSFDPPEGWEVRSSPGLKFKVVIGPKGAGFAPNINVVDDSHNGSLSAYVEATLAALPKILKRFRLLQRDDFVTTDGVNGARLIIENEQLGKVLRQSFYVFPKGSTMFVVTCSALSDGGADLDSVFEASMKTFRLSSQ